MDKRALVEQLTERLRAAARTARRASLEAAQEARGGDLRKDQPVVLGAGDPVALALHLRSGQFAFRGGAQVELHDYALSAALLQARLEAGGRALSVTAPPGASRFFST